jgi:hypothetical protein
MPGQEADHLMSRQLDRHEAWLVQLGSATNTELSA